VDWHFNKATHNVTKTNNELGNELRIVKIEKVSSLPISKVTNCQLAAASIKIKPPKFISPKTLSTPNTHLSALKYEPKLWSSEHLDKFKSSGINKNEVSTNESKSKFPKGVLSTILAVVTWAFIFLGIVLIFSTAGELLALLFLGLAVVTLITSLSLGIAAMASPKDTTDLVFGIIGSALASLTIAIIISSVFL